jgi:hypothetical protein
VSAPGGQPSPSPPNSPDFRALAEHCRQAAASLQRAVESFTADVKEILRSAAAEEAERVINSAERIADQDRGRR